MSDLSLGIAPLAPEEICRAWCSKRTRRTVNKLALNFSASPAAFFFSFINHRAPSSSDTHPPFQRSLPEGMVVDPAGPGAIVRLLRDSAFFSCGVRSDLKGDESRTLFPAVDVVPAAGHL